MKLPLCPQEQIVQYAGQKDPAHRCSDSRGSRRAGGTALEVVRRKAALSLNNSVSALIKLDRHAKNTQKTIIITIHSESYAATTESRWESAVIPRPNQMGWGKLRTAVNGHIH